jgi:hypothetical protein
MSYTQIVRFVWLLSLALALPAAAVPLPPDSNAEPSGVTPPPGTAIDQGMLPFELVNLEISSTPVATGTVSWEAVVEGSGLMRFEFVLTNDAESAEGVSELSTSGYVSYSVNADFDAASAGDAEPLSVDRNHAGGPRVSFFFGKGEDPGIAFGS